MKKFFSIFFMVLGVLFFILILLSVYLYVADPFNVRPLIDMLRGDGAPVERVENVPQSSDTVEPAAAPTTAAESSANVSAEQAAALEKLGFDPANVPANIPLEQEACFEATLGVARVAEIKAGASPTATDLFKARGCLE